MAATAPYIPAKDADLNSWLVNFSTLLTAAPGTYGLTSSDATTVAGYVAAWTAAYTPTLSPATKTAAAVQAKATEKVLVLSQVRPFAQQVSLNAGVTSANKIAIGVNPRTSTPTPIPVPVTNPVLTIDSTSTAGSVLRYRDTTASPSSKAKPFGAIGMQLFAKSSSTPITDPDTLTLQSTLTKSPAIVSLGSTEAGKIVYFAGRWITRKGEVGPWSPIISYVVAG